MNKYSGRHNAQYFEEVSVSLYNERHRVIRAIGRVFCFWQSIIGPLQCKERVGLSHNPHFHFIQVIQKQREDFILLGCIQSAVNVFTMHFHRTHTDA